MEMRRHRRFLSEAKFVVAHFALNLQAAMEYRASFISQIVGMMLNDAIWIFFWFVFFARFKVVKGWEFEDVLMLWAILTVAYGIATGICGNALRLSRIIAEGGLDFFLGLPRNVLVSVLVARLNISALGDLLFGLILWAFVGTFTPGAIALYLFVTLAAASIIVSWFVLVNSLAFFIGSSENLSMQMLNALLSFATYPFSIFTGPVRFLLFTLIPAAFIGYMPVMILKETNWLYILALAGFAVLLAGIARFVFFYGLRRYESGNLVLVRM
jgi:ABC-2 type transport system permease protein